MMHRRNLSGKISSNHSCIDGESVGWSFHYSMIETVTSVVLQLVGLFLVVSTVVMFVKHRVLRKAENVLHVNLLVCCLLLLLLDWYILETGQTGCEVYTLSLLLFGSAGTFTTVCIAIERYKRMVHMMPATLRQCCIWMCMIWLTSLLLVLYPSWTTMMEMSRGLEYLATIEHAHSVTCFFSDSYLYASLHYSLSFLCLVVIVPVTVKLFCYIKVFQHVKRASMNRWIHHASAQCSQHTRVIRPTQRKGNIIQLSNTRPKVEYRQTNRLSSRDKSILLKGITSVFLVLFCWLPFASFWIKISIHGFSREYPKQFLYTVLLAKASAVLSIAHYMSFNSKFRRYYMKSTFGPLLKKVNCAVVGVIPEENTSQIISNSTISRINISRDILPFPTTRLFQLESINELRVKESFRRHSPRLQRRASAINFTLPRSLSTPDRIRSRQVEPRNIFITRKWSCPETSRK